MGVSDVITGEWGERGWSTWERGVGVLGRGGLEYLGKGGWSTWERGGGVLEYLREGGWSCILLSFAF